MNQPDYVVGVGASAGGLEAIEHFFDAALANTGLAFVVVQHLSPDFRSMMSQLLARHTAMPIQLVEDGMAIEAGVIYLIPARKNMVIRDGCLRLLDQEPTVGLKLPIDIFFHSLAKSFGDRSIAVVLSGTGSDGSRGIKSVHEAGGLVLVQDLESSAFDGMPRNAIATRKADVVCHPSRMPERILEFVQDPQGFVRGQVEASDSQEDDGDRTGLIRLFRRKYGIDFSFYKPTTINRRLDRRMQLANAVNFEQYMTTLESDSEELDTLYRDLLVEVTRFFRDPEAFDRLRFELLPELVQNADNEIRVWVPACATGEEAYSLAMILHHLAQASKSPAVRIKIFATDMHHKSLELASAAVFRPESVANVPEDYLKAYFSKIDDLYHLSREIREHVVFAQHDITKDPPFTRVDLISCRNVLIYLEPHIQQRVLSMFHFGLKPDGLMFLGPSETVGDLASEFTSVDKHWRIYRKIRNIRLLANDTMQMGAAFPRVVLAERPANSVSPAVQQ